MANINHSGSSGAATIDAKVAQTENAIQKAIAASGHSEDFSKLSLTQSLPLRPQYGSQGNKVIVFTNSFELQINPALKLNRYRIEVKALGATDGRDKPAGKKLIRIVELFLNSNPLPDCGVFYDYRSIVICIGGSPKSPAPQSVKASVRYYAEGESPPGSTAPTHEVSLVHENHLFVSDLLDYVGSKDATTSALQYKSTNLSNCDAKTPIIQALNIILSSIARKNSNTVKVGSNRVFMLNAGGRDRLNIQRGLFVLRGFFRSVRPATARILVNVNPSYSAFYNAGPLTDLIRDFGTGNDQIKLERFLKRLRVQPSYLKRGGQVVHRVKIIYGLANPNDGKKRDGTRSMCYPPRVSWHGSPPKHVHFYLESKKQHMSVSEFFKTEHDKPDLEDSQMPVVNVGTREKPTYLPAEVCKVLPGQRYMAKLDAQQTASMITFGARRPDRNVPSILSQGFKMVGLEALKQGPLADFFRSGPNLVSIPGRVLSAPELIYKGGKNNRMVAPSDGSWNLTGGLEFYYPVKITSWKVLWIKSKVFREKTDLATLKGILSKFQSTLRGMGLDKLPTFEMQTVELPNDRHGPRGQVAMIDNILKQTAERKIGLLFIILPSEKMPLYNDIKKLGDQKYGVDTVCSVVGRVTKKKSGDDQYFRNLAVKINLKLGGIDHLVASNSMKQIKEYRAMLVGLDVTHPSPGSAPNAPSIVCMVASADSNYAQYTSSLRVQSKPRQEVVSENDMLSMFESRLQIFRQKNNILPQRVFYFRDGVSEGQYQAVLDDEVPGMRKAMKKLYPKDNLPKLTVVINSKRHHVRFYTKNDKSAQNCKPGTVVDMGVTEARSWDFYLQAHKAIQGTARPSHYITILNEAITKDSNRTEADFLENLALTLSYAYSRATRAVSISTPCFYAHLGCMRGRCFLSDYYDFDPAADRPVSVDKIRVITNADLEVHPQLRDRMFYI